jgi:hypothetical protein
VVCSGGGRGGDDGVGDRWRWAIRVGVLEEGDGGELGLSWTRAAPLASEWLQVAPRAPGDGSVMVLADETAHSTRRRGSGIGGGGVHDRRSMAQQGMGGRARWERSEEAKACLLKEALQW